MFVEKENFLQFFIIYFRNFVSALLSSLGLTFGRPVTSEPEHGVNINSLK